MTTKEMLKAIKSYSYSEKVADRLFCFGVRGDDRDVKVGDYLDTSYGWDYENDIQSEEKLNGTCAINLSDLNLCATDDLEQDQEDIEKIEQALDFFENTYNYEHISIIGGKSCEGGEDENEVIIEDAQVLYVIR